MPSEIVWPGDEVPEGVGPVRCPRREGERLCAGVLGWPPTGSTLVEVVAPGERLGACEPGFSAFLCRDCGAVAVFAVEAVAAVGGEA